MPPGPAPAPATTARISASRGGSGPVISRCSARAPPTSPLLAEGRGQTPRVVHLQEPAQDPQRPDQDDVGREGHQGLEAGVGPVRLGEPARLDPLAEGGDEGVEVGLCIDRVNVPGTVPAGSLGVSCWRHSVGKAPAYSRPERGGGGR